MTEHTGGDRGIAVPDESMTEDPQTVELEEEAKQAVDAKPEPDDPVELASDESFPASDPPSW